MLLACSWLGLTFIPVSPDTVDRRILAIIDIADPALHLQAADGHRAGIPAHVGTARFSEHGLTVDRPPGPRIRHRAEVLPTDPAYIIFTSGSTGVPKGVVMSHRAVISFYRGVLHQDIVRAQDRVAVTAPLQFDFSLAGIGAALGSGATVVLVPADRIGWPKRFVSFLRDAGVTQVHGVPSIWRNMLKDEPDRLAGLDQLRLVLFAGEEFPLHELRLLQQRLPKVHLMNAYGATETMACSVTVVPNPLPGDVTRLSIGFAHAGAEMMIVGEHGQPVEDPGEVAEIYIRSPAMFTGYWDDPGATRAAQVPDPLNPRSGELVFRSGDLAYRGQHGELYFCGRVDSQVKIRGNRVELGEVERRIADFPAVADAAVLSLPRLDGELGLYAFVVMKPDSSASPADLRSFCAETLPGYMLPRHIHVMDELPLNENGKADRSALTAFTQSARQFTSTRADEAPARL
jgi:amino acid adenylation domain-containing protein